MRIKKFILQRDFKSAFCSSSKTKHIKGLLSVSEIKWEEGKELFKEISKESSLGKGKKKSKDRKKG